MPVNRGAGDELPVNVVVVNVHSAGHRVALAHHDGARLGQAPTRHALPHVSEGACGEVRRGCRQIQPRELVGAIVPSIVVAPPHAIGNGAPAQRVGNARTLEDGHMAVFGVIGEVDGAQRDGRDARVGARRVHGQHIRYRAPAQVPYAEIDVLEHVVVLEEAR